MNQEEFIQQANTDGCEKIAIVFMENSIPFIGDLNLPTNLKEFGFIRIPLDNFVREIKIAEVARRDYRRGLLTSEERIELTDNKIWVNYFTNSDFRIINIYDSESFRIHPSPLDLKTRTLSNYEIKETINNVLGRISSLNSFFIFDVSATTLIPDHRFEIPKILRLPKNIEYLCLNGMVIKSLPLEIRTSKKLTMLDLRFSEIKIPPEFLEKVNDSHSILNYYNLIVAGNSEIHPLNQTKLNFLSLDKDR